MIEILRKTKETDIAVILDLKAEPFAKINTGVGFFDHMLTAFAIHCSISLQVSCKGDLGVDCHHTIEDVGIAIGKAFLSELGDKSGISRYGSFYIPMDEALGFCSLDISSRPFLVFDAQFSSDKIGDMSSQMVEEFFKAFCFNAGITLHLKVLYGKNDHHKVEALFKAFAHSLRLALIPQNEGEVLSTKGIL